MSARRLWPRVALTILAGAAASLTLFPIVWMALLSLKTQRDALALPPRWIFEPSLEAYRAVWMKGGFAQGFANSLVTGTSTLAVVLPIALLAAYALSRYRFRGGRAVLYGMFVTRLFPPVALVTPIFLSASWLGLHDRTPTLVLAYAALNLPLAVWMLKGYFDAVPEELEHSAMVDGASRPQAVLRVVLPLMAPGLAATGVFVFVGAWNEFLFALTLTSREARTLPTVIAEFVGDTGIEWPQIMAASTIALAPVLVATFALQRHIAAGMTSGAVKG
ncbi:carbohydrate ABC transporter permease [Falsiroseomonas sp. HW251]|uniref:carbohydrate ABC transporter permease n=1 Tax=Falsiroseomonas sp. HW251 TaxID=3390998 RepID=UPI003D31A6A8